MECEMQYRTRVLYSSGEIAVLNIDNVSLHLVESFLVHTLLSIL